MRTRFFTFLLFALSFSAYSQYYIKGRVLSLPDKQPIAFANIGIVDAAIGTISDEDGSFSFRIPSRHDKDDVLFSALGYSRVSIPVSKLSTHSAITVYLKETAYNLNEVVLIAERMKSRIYRAGNRRYDGGSVYADTITAGSMMALLIRNTSSSGKTQFQYPAYIKEAQVRIVKNTFPEFKVRVRLLEADTLSGVPIPGEDILNESIVIKSGIIDAWLKVDLSRYNIEIDRDFFVAFEWILETKDRVALYRQFEKFRRENPGQVREDFSYVDGERVAYDNYQGNFYFGTSFGMSVGYATLKDHICYYRLNSFGRWYRSPSVLATTVIFSEQPGSGQDEEENPLPETDMDWLPSYYSFTPLHAEISEDSSMLAGKAIHHFHTRIAEPVSIEVWRSRNEFSFFARNVSFYPYHISLDFSGILNLQPIVTKEAFTVYPGLHKLLVLRIVDPSIEKYNFNLSVKHSIGDPEMEPVYEFPYLVPSRSRSGAKLISIVTSEIGTEYTKDIFILHERDTGYAMRKGMVTCTHKSDLLVDRLSGPEALEIRHTDGTVMIYSGLDPLDLFVHAGSTVYPGQPLGTVDTNKELKVHLYHPTGNRVDKLEIYYFLGQGRTGEYSELPKGLDIIYPESIIVMEMTDNERKMFKQRKIF